MTTTRTLTALTSLLLAGSLTGCDAEGPEAAALDYRAVGHVSLSTLMAAPWVADAMKDGQVKIDAKLGPCADLLRATDAITFGADEDAFEAYVEGSFDAATANACSDHIDATIASRAPRPDSKRPKPETTLLADGVFVVFGGDLTPSGDRLAGLQTADPSGGQPMWITADMTGKGKPVDRVQAWANPAKGLKAHAEVVFAEEAKAAEVYGKATLGLAAMSLSDEVGELASAVDLDSSGATMTAEVSLSPAQMKTLAARGKARRQAHHAELRARVEAGESGESGIQIHFGSGQ